MTDTTEKRIGGHKKEFKLVKDLERLLEVRLESKRFLQLDSICISTRKEVSPS